MRPATIGDGILRLDEEKVNMMTAVFDADREFYQFTKFVPASGAASRMFKDLFSFIETAEETKFTDIFFAHIHSLPSSTTLTPRQNGSMAMTLTPY